MAVTKWLSCNKSTLSCFGFGLMSPKQHILSQYNPGAKIVPCGTHHTEVSVLFHDRNCLGEDMNDFL